MDAFDMFREPPNRVTGTHEGDLTVLVLQAATIDSPCPLENHAVEASINDHSWLWLERDCHHRAGPAKAAQNLDATCRRNSAVLGLRCVSSVSCMSSTVEWLRRRRCGR